MSKVKINKCDCALCKEIDKDRWKTIMECGCLCHTEHGIIGHSSLCCEYPNGKKCDNPYKDKKLTNEQS